MNYPDKLSNIIQILELLPTVGKKTAERLALHIFTEFSKERIIQFSDSIKELNNLSICPTCFGLSENNEVCHICNDDNRDKETIMVVENLKDVIVFEKTKAYFGLYHVLNGSINFASNRSIESLNIDSLVKRIDDFKVKEVILATSLSTEGEFTTQYISKLLSQKECSITKLAQGLPVGADISYADDITLNKAINGRMKL